jgi:hypothetical protein
VKRKINALIAASVFFLAGLAAAATCPPNLGPRETPTADFVVNADGTVLHTSTGLLWKQCNEGLSGAGCLTGTATTATWSNALTAAAISTFAGYGDWRLPSKPELESILEYTCHSPSINETVFPNTASSSNWTSTTSDNPSPSTAWTVDFKFGWSFGRRIFKTSLQYVRLVRGGSAFDSLANLPCTLDINADGAVNAATDGVLLLRYLLGFRGAALIDGVTIGPTRGGAAGVESLIGTAAKYDVFGRPAPVVTALSDGLVLARLMNGVPDTALLNNVPLPAGATNLLAATVRSSVNARCGTSF